MLFLFIRAKKLVVKIALGVKIHSYVNFSQLFFWRVQEMARQVCGWTSFHSTFADFLRTQKRGPLGTPGIPPRGIEPGPPGPVKSQSMRATHADLHGTKSI